MALAAIGGGVGGGIGGAGLPGAAGGGVAGFAQGAVRGVLDNVLTQGASLALGLQQRFDFAGLGGGGRDVWRQVRSGAASAIAGAATRSIVTGTSFGDNVLAVLPDVIGSTIGRLAGHAVAARAAAAAASRSAGRAAVADPQLAIDMTGLLDDDGVTGGAGAVAVADGVRRWSTPGGTVTIEEIPERKKMPPGPVTEVGDARDLMTWALRKEVYEAGKLPGHDYSRSDAAFTRNLKDILRNDAATAGQVAQVDLVFGGAMAAWGAPLAVPAMVEGGILATAAGILELSAGLNNVGGIGTAAAGRTERPLDMIAGSGASSILDAVGGVTSLAAGFRLGRASAAGAEVAEREIPIWKGAGPIPGTFGVNVESLSTKGLQNFFPKRVNVEYVFDPDTSTLVVGNGRMPHTPLAASIGADKSRVVSGIFNRGPDGAMLTNEASGHFWQNWTPEIRH